VSAALTFTSYLRNEAGDFVEVSTFRAPPVDPLDVEGALVICVSGVEFMGLRHWDYVDQLWVYLVDAFVKFRTTGQAETTFPDQPLEFRLARRGPMVLLSLGYKGEYRRATVDEQEWAAAFVDAAEHFFLNMIRLYPDDAAPYHSALQGVAGLRQAYGLR
jgi:hypothetical protein